MNETDERPVLKVVRSPAEEADAVALAAAQSGEYDYGSWLLVRDHEVVASFADYDKALDAQQSQGGTLHMVGHHDPGTVNLNQNVRPVPVVKPK